MKLIDLLWNIKVQTSKGDLGVDIVHVAFDSRNIQPGTLFCCFPGLKSDGHDYAKVAVQNGAVAVICQRELDLPQEITQIIVQDARAAMAVVSGNFFGNPGQYLQLIGITGTNGKTMTTYLLAAIGRAFGKKMGIIGTIATVIDEEVIDTNMTTPDPFVLHSLLRKMVDAGVQWVAVEVTAHALWLRKTVGLFFEVGVFTNFSQDHLNDFGTMENYFAAKAKLFEPGVCANAVLCADDPSVMRIADQLEIPVTTYGEMFGADVRVMDLQLSPGGTSLKLSQHGREIDVKVGVPGRFSALNAAAAAAAAAAIGVPWPVIRYGLMQAQGVPGRMQVVKGGRGNFLVDYAHTPDALHNMLVSARSFTQGRLCVVFGCGGNRDKEKRAVMGQLASQLADYCIITSDNPREEDPNDIAQQIAKGASGGKALVEVEVDRRAAIKKAVNWACEDDVVVVAGKGHEKTQEMHGQKLPFDDVAVLQELF